MGTADSAIRLLSPKLHLPPTRKKWVLRSCLLEKLNTAANHKLTLLCAPAGYGKTTLLSQWINQCNTPVGWLSLDAGDNELTQFTRYFVAAIQQIDPNICPFLPQMLQPPQPLSMTEAWIYLINELSASQKEFFIILDDYQEIQNQLIHDQLGYLLEHMPINLHLLIATRADPPINLPGLRVKGQLLEIRADVLCFNAEDAKSFFHDVIGLPLSDEDSLALVQKTEGWVAGLQIAGIVLQKQANLPQAVQNFTGSHRHVLDYLVTEVIDHLPAATQNFIQQTVILDSLEASLCNAVTGREDSQKILEQLELANQFIIPLDNNRHWYRYHRLLKEALQRRTADMDSRQWAEYHLKASIWFEQHDKTEEAIHHAFMADDLNRAARVIDRDGEKLIKHSQIATLLQWINRLTPEQFHNFPRLNLTRAWATLFKGKAIHSVRDQLESSTSQAWNALEEAEKEVIRGMVAIMTGEVQQALAYSNQALRNLPTEKGFLRSIANWNLAMAYVVLGDFSAAIQAFRENIASALEMNNTMFAVASLCNLGGLYLIQGHLKLSASVYHQALELATTASGNRLPVACRALMGLSEIAREWNQLKQAQNLLEEAIKLSQQYNQTSELIMLLSLARVTFAQGNEDHALDLAQKALAMAIQSSETQIDDRLVEVSLARFWLKQGNISAAMDWAAKRGFGQAPANPPLAENDTPGVPYELRMAEWLTFTRLQLAQNHFEDALQALTLLLAEAEKKKHTRQQHEILILMALAYQATGRMQQALESLSRSITQAEPEGYIRIYLDEGLPIVKLLRESARTGKHKAYCHQLLNALHQEQPIFTLDQPGLVEPLSERELEILQLLAEGCTNREICERLYISLSTVKGHVSNIYGKLLSKNRTEAVARARQLKIISSN